MKREPLAQRKSETISVEEALEQVLSMGEALEAEEVPFMESLGRVLARDVVSDINVPPFDNSQMDGFAVREADIQGARHQAPVELEVIELIAAGDFPQREVGPGQCARIMTGAAMPAGADTVIKIEQTSAYEGGGAPGETVGIRETTARGTYVRATGEDAREGRAILGAGEVVDAAAIGLMAATGNQRVWVHRRPRVGIVATGSELVDVSEKPAPGKIRNSNSYAIAAQTVLAGGVPVVYPVVKDNYEATLEAFSKAAAENDLIVTSGGVSVGDFDYVRPALEALGEMRFCKVFMRPGNPQTMGKIGNTVFFGLPGNPSSCYVGFEMFLRPLIMKMQGFTRFERPVMRATLASTLKKKQERRYYDRGRVFKDTDGTLVAQPVMSQNSALLTTMHEANALIVLPEGIGDVPAGTQVDCLMMRMSESSVL